MQKAVSWKKIAFLNINAIIVSIAMRKRGIHHDY